MFRITLLTLFLASASSGLAQTIQISGNRKLEFKKNYPPLENPGDTTYILLDFERELLEVKKKSKTLANIKWTISDSR